MSVEPNDPRLTAYALGELDAEEAKSFEAELDDEARAEIEDIRETAALLERELASEDGPGLDSGRRQRIEDELEKPVPAPIPLKPKAKPKPRRWLWAVAAALPVAFVLGSLSLTTGRSSAPMAAQRAESDDRAAVAAPPPPAALASAASGALAFDSESEGKRKLDGDHGDLRGTNLFQGLPENPFIPTTKDPRSTFSIDVDTASYSIVRRLLNQGQLPPTNAVRIEEMINYFSYAYPQPKDGIFTVSNEVSQAPWATSHRLVRIGIKGKEIPMANRPASNLVFLLDVSGSMEEQSKLPLLKRAFRLLVEQLGENDHVSIVVYAGASGVVLPPTSATKKEEIFSALDRLSAGGSTNGGEGIQLAYAMAARHFVAGGTNRVILATDGDFNVGLSDQNALVKLIEQKAKGGVFLSVLGFGMGNLKDGTLEKLADKGNGNYAYIDDIAEARKVLVEQGAGTLVTIAKDVKIQVEFDPKEVESFRLIGYENRVLAHKDFTNDEKDAGDIGAGHTVTALYEVVPTAAHTTGDLMTVKLRYKLPTSNTSKPLDIQVRDRETPIASASADFRFAAAVASFGMLLRQSPNKGDSSYASVVELAEGAIGDSTDAASRREFVSLAKTAQRMGGR